MLTVSDFKTTTSDPLPKKYVEIPRHVQITQKKKGKRRIECDVRVVLLWKKKDKQWIWLALDKETKEIVGAYIGKRDKNAAKKLWESLPPVYRQCAVCYTDFRELLCGSHSQ